MLLLLRDRERERERQTRGEIERERERYRLKDSEKRERERERGSRSLHVDPPQTPPLLLQSDFQGSDLVGDGRRVKQVQTKLGFDDARSSSRIPRLLVIFSLLCVVTRREPSRRLDAFVGSFRAIFAHNTEIGRGALQLVTLLFKMHLESGVLELQRVHSSDALRATARTLRWCLRWRCGHYLADL